MRISTYTYKVAVGNELLFSALARCLEWDDCGNRFSARRMAAFGREADAKIAPISGCKMTENGQQQTLEL